MNHVLTAFLTLLAALPLHAQDQAEADADWDARIVSVKGEVTVFTLEEPEGVTGAKDMPLEAGDRIKTGEDSSAEIGLNDQSLIALRSNSDFTLASIKQADSRFKLALGSLLAKIRSLGTGRLEVETPVAVAAVRGTEFGVELDADDAGAAHIGVFDEGRVEVREVGGAAKELLIANQETRVNRGAGPLPPYQLTRFAARRAMVRGFRSKIQALRRDYRRLPRAERREKRRKAISAMREKRRARLQQLEQRREGRRRQPELDAETLRNREQMQKRRQRIKDRRRP